MKNRRRGPSAEQLAELQAILDNATAMTAKRQASRQYHLVPRFYLNERAVEGQAQVTDPSQQRKTVSVRPEQALVETDYYRIDEDMVAGGSPVAWESWLSKVEAIAALLLPIVRGHGLHTLPLEDQGRLLQFVAIQITRSRYYRLQGRWMLGHGESGRCADRLVARTRHKLLSVTSPPLVSARCRTVSRRRPALTSTLSRRKRAPVAPLAHGRQRQLQRYRCMPRSQHL